MSETFTLRDARVLLTGATGGIGTELARAFHARGAQLILTGRRGEVLRPLAKELEATTITADLAEPAAVERLLAEAGPIDVLVANAALPASGAVLDFSTEELDRALQINLRAPMIMARTLAEQMQARGRGRICFVGSLAGIAASPGGGVYSATKFGLRGFALGFRQDLHGTGVGVSIVEPGFIRDAGMFADAGAPAPPMMRTVSPRQVTDGVIDAIERDRGEVIVAPVELRVGATIGSVLPGVAEVFQRGEAAQRTSRQLAGGQREKR
jgi:short-subunit dehydrogenase